MGDIKSVSQSIFCDHLDFIWTQLYTDQNLILIDNECPCVEKNDPDVSMKHVQFFTHVCCFFLCTDAEPDDTGKYRVEVGNDSGTAHVDFGVKVKGQGKTSMKTTN